MFCPDFNNLQKKDKNKTLDFSFLVTLMLYWSLDVFGRR